MQAVTFPKNAILPDDSDFIRHYEKQFLKNPFMHHFTGRLRGYLLLSVAHPHSFFVMMYQRRLSIVLTTLLCLKKDRTRPFLLCLAG